MKVEEQIHRSFCTAYSDAVLLYVRQGTNSDVVFNAETQRFQSRMVSAEISPAQCEWWVGSDWPSFVGPLTCRIDAKHPQFSEKLLGIQIAFALARSPTGRRMSRILAGLD